MLTFIHTPKCGGTYTGKILEYLKIPNKGHTKYNSPESITFTIIRDPVDRFKSLLNFRSNLPPHSMPGKMEHSITPSVLYESLTLDEIVSKMTDDEILGFTSYNTLVYWTENVDIVITIDELPELLGRFGYTYPNFEKENVSLKNKGTFNEETRNRVKILFAEDVILFNKIKLKTFSDF